MAQVGYAKFFPASCESALGRYKGVCLGSDMVKTNGFRFCLDSFADFGQERRSAPHFAAIWPDAAYGCQGRAVEGRAERKYVGDSSIRSQFGCIERADESSIEWPIRMRSLRFVSSRISFACSSTSAA